MTAPHRINADLGLPVVRCERRKYRQSRMERLGERILNWVLILSVPALVVGVIVARWLT